MEILDSEMMTLMLDFFWNTLVRVLNREMMKVRQETREAVETTTSSDQC